MADSVYNGSDPAAGGTSDPGSATSQGGSTYGSGASAPAVTNETNYNPDPVNPDEGGSSTVGNATQDVSQGYSSGDTVFTDSKGGAVGGSAPQPKVSGKPPVSKTGSTSTGGSNTWKWVLGLALLGAGGALVAHHEKQKKSA